VTIAPCAWPWSPSAARRAPSCAPRQTGAALVVPADTSAALAAGQPSQLILYTDPVKVIELDVIRDLVQEIRHEVELAARDEAVAELEATRHRALEARAALGALLAPLRSFLVDLDARGRAFTAWAEAARARAGRFADRIPHRLIRRPCRRRSLSSRAPSPPLSPVWYLRCRCLRFRPSSCPPLPAPPAGLHLPELPEPPAVHLPGMLAIEETSVTGAPRTFNTFDQNVPGFSITFLLLGILLGISLALLDEGHVAELTIADSITSFPACVPFWSAGSLN
jgi:hypothetical protein